MLIEQSLVNNKLAEFVLTQIDIEGKSCLKHRKQNGTFLTNNLAIIKTVLSYLPSDDSLFSQLILEPSCGQGIFLLEIIFKAYLIKPCPDTIRDFIEKNLFFVDLEYQMIKFTESNISELYNFLFKKQYLGKFNSFCLDFTLKQQQSNLYNYYGRFDYVVGNPPYITLYGRRDKKKSESQRIYYLENYNQFPAELKNGKINYVMLFLEHGLEFLKNNGMISYIIDISFFETAYKYCRKYLLENTRIQRLVYNITSFDSVASGQIVISLEKQKVISNNVLTIDLEKSTKQYINQVEWNQEEDEYKFRLDTCSVTNLILGKVLAKDDPTLNILYPQKNLRTCTMLLDMEDRFTTDERPKSSDVKAYPYYQGSKSIKYKYDQPNHIKYFLYNKILQNEINDQLKEKLTEQGIKNKKRIGLGEIIIYDNPKIYIRQSAKELIATYDESPSAANNSLYVFSLRDNSDSSIYFLKYLCGLINSNIYTFFAQQRRIIRYNKGKQPQIKISDLYQIKIPTNTDLQSQISTLVDSLYNQTVCLEKIQIEINALLYDYYQLTNAEIKFLEESIESFLQ